MLSGGIVPLNFFPETLRHIIDVLPFQAIYHIPITMLTDHTLQPAQFIRMLGIQLIWVLVFAVLGALGYQQAIKVLTVNGG